MVIIHYAGITSNRSSGVSVVVPQIVNNMSKLEQVALYNYTAESVKIEKPAIQIDNRCYSDDYHTFPEPFSNPDIVVFHSPFGIPKMKNIIPMLLKDKIPYVIVPHGCFASVAMKKKKLKKVLAVKIYFNRALKNATAIQYLCENERRQSVFQLPYIIVPNGTEIPNKIVRDYNEIRHLTFIGRKDFYQKGIDVLLDGCALIKSELEQNGIEISIYGPGSDKQEKMINRKINEYNLTNIIYSKPSIFGEDKIEVLKKSDLFILTSRSEGQPLAVLEAMSYSLPVFITPGTGFTEEVTFNNCGKSVELTAQGIADGLNDIIHDKAFLKYASRNAYNYVSREYSWMNVARRTISAYKGLI